MGRLVMLLLATMLVGCDGRKPQASVFEAQTDALRKAREVEQKVNAGGQATRQAIDAAQQGGN